MYPPSHTGSKDGVGWLVYMAKQIQTMLGDSEYEHMEAARAKAGETLYGFFKTAVLQRADAILAGDETPVIKEMADAVANRKYALYQMTDYSDKNHLNWLEIRFPRTTDRQRSEALRLFREWKERGSQ